MTEVSFRPAPCSTGRRHRWKSPVGAGQRQWLRGRQTDVPSGDGDLALPDLLTACQMMLLTGAGWHALFAPKLDSDGLELDGDGQGSLSPAGQVVTGSRRVLVVHECSGALGLVAVGQRAGASSVDVAVQLDQHGRFSDEGTWIAGREWSTWLNEAAGGPDFRRREMGWPPAWAPGQGGRGSRSRRHPVEWRCAARS